MSSLRITDVVTRYNGDGDVVAWLDRLEVVVRLKKESADLVNIIPMFMEGAAYDVFAQMPAAEQSDTERLKAGLKQAFGMTPALAFRKFKERSLLAGEAPDALMADLRRLARTVATGGDNDTIDAFVCCQFVDGLPEPTRSQIRAIKSGGAWNVDEVLTCAKGMLLQSELAVDVGGGFMGAEARGGQAATTMPGAAGKTGGQKTGPRCVGCFRWGHLQSNCEVRCFKCGGVGHLKRACQVQGNGHRGAV